MDLNDIYTSEMIEIFPAPGDVEAEDWFEKMEDWLGDFDCTDCESLMESVVDDLLGVHGFYIFRKYPFNIQLQIPGTLLAGNYHSREGGKLVWNFSQEEFHFYKYDLFAKSRVIYWHRLFLLSCGLLILALWFRQRTRA